MVMRSARRPVEIQATCCCMVVLCLRLVSGVEVAHQPKQTQGSDMVHHARSWLRLEQPTSLLQMQANKQTADTGGTTGYTPVGVLLQATDVAVQLSPIPTLMQASESMGGAKMSYFPVDDNARIDREIHAKFDESRRNNGMLMVLSCVVLSLVLMRVASSISAQMGQITVNVSDEATMMAELDQLRIEIHQWQCEINERRGLEPPPTSKQMNQETLANVEQGMGQATEEVARREKEMAAIAECAKRAQGLAKEEADEVKAKIQVFGKDLADELSTKMKTALEAASAEANDHAEAIQNMDLAGGGDDDEVSAEHAAKVEQMMNQHKEWLPPPFSLILGGFMARSQIASIGSSSYSKVTFYSTTFVISAFLIFMDGRKSCQTYQPLWWVTSYLLQSLILSVINFMLWSRCATCIASDDVDYDEVMENRSGKPPDTSSYFSVYAYFQENRGGFLTMLFKLCELEKSYLYRFLNWLTILGYIWDFYAVVIIMGDVVELEADGACDQRMIVKFMELYATLTLMMSLNILAAIVCNMICILLRCEGSVISTLISAAKYIDTWFLAEIPVVVTLLRTFVVRDTSTLLTLLEIEKVKKIKRIEQEIRDDQATVADMSAVFGRVSAMEEDVQKLDQDWLYNFYQSIGQAAAKVGPLVALASNPDAVKDFANSKAAQDMKQGLAMMEAETRTAVEGAVQQAAAAADVAAQEATQAALGVAKKRPSALRGSASSSPGAHGMNPGSPGDGPRPGSPGNPA